MLFVTDNIRNYSKSGKTKIIYFSEIKKDADGEWNQMDQKRECLCLNLLKGSIQKFSNKNTTNRCRNSYDEEMEEEQDQWLEHCNTLG